MASVYLQDDPSASLSLPRTTMVPLPLPWGAVARILLSWPAAAPGPEGHPLLVLLGGEHQFGLARDLAGLLAGDPAAPAGFGIIAALEPDEEGGFDLPWPGGPDEASGRALADTLAHAIDGGFGREMAIDRTRVAAIGFGAAARFAVEMVHEAPEIFALTVAANPAIWPGGPPVFDAEALRERLTVLAPRQLVLLSGREGDGRGRRSRFAANARTIAGRLAEARLTGLSTSVSVVGDNDPAALVSAATSLAIRLAFGPQQGMAMGTPPP